MRWWMAALAGLTACSSGGEPGPDGDDGGATTPTSLSEVPAPTRLAAAPAGRPRLCVSDTGAATVAWSDGDELWAAHAADGKTFGDPVRLDGGALSPNGLVVACDGASAAVAWTDGRGNRLQSSRPYVRVTEDGVAWGDEALVGTFAETTSAIDPALAMADGTIWLGWADNAAGSFDMHVASRSMAGAWGDPVRLGDTKPGTVYSGGLALHATASGALAAWLDDEQVQVSASPFTASRALDSMGFEVSLCGMEGQIHLVTSDGLDRIASVRHSVDGGQSWTDEVVLRGVVLPSCAALEPGRSQLVWFADDGVGAGAVVEGGVLGTEVRMEEVQGAPIVASFGGRTLVGWDELDSVQVRWSDDLGTTSQPVGDGEQYNVQVGMGGPTRMLVVVGELDGDDGLWAVPL